MSEYHHSQYDAETIKDIQRRMGVTADGIWGPGTVQALAAWVAENPGLSFSDFNKAWGKEGTVSEPTPSPCPAPAGPLLPQQDIRWFRREDPWGKLGKAFMIDVSRHQRKPDWAAVKAHAGLAGVIIKATEGRTYTDPEFERNREGCQENGIPWAIYHYCHLAWDGKITNVPGAADNIEKALDGDMPPLGIWLDLETKEVQELVAIVGPARTADWIEVFVSELTKRTGKAPGLYWSRRSITARGGIGSHGERFKHLPMWWAYYPTPPSPLNRNDGYPAGHKDLPDHQTWAWDLWQFSSKGRVPGIVGNVDLNVVNDDDVRDLQARMGL